MTLPATQRKPGDKGGKAKSASPKTSGAGTKKAAAKKRAPSKKKKRGFNYTALLAFVAGLTLACLAFLVLRDISFPSLRDISLPSLRDIVDQQSPGPAFESRGQETRPSLPPVVLAQPDGRFADGIDRPILPRVEEWRIPTDAKNGRETAQAVGSALADLQSLALSRPPRAGEAKLAIIIDDLGFSRTAVRQVLALDYPVACAFLPHGKHTPAGARAAHAKGREILIHQPMEPVGYPKVNPGPQALLVGMSDSQIRRILNDSIAAVPHAVGLSNHMGSQFTQEADEVGSVIQKLKERGLFILDSLTHKNSVFAGQGRRMGIEHYSRTVFLDASPSREKILEELRRAEHIALFTGQAVAIGHPLPETLAALNEWQHLRNPKVRIVKLRELGQNGK
jgi:polysaccharide deacetylase 2 family uncharacterized protein YibQ